jgi:hypothetical protein
MFLYQLIMHYFNKAYGGVEVQIHVFLASTLLGGDWSDSRPSRLNPNERASGTHTIGVWVSFGISLDHMEY